MANPAEIPPENLLPIINELGRKTETSLAALKAVVARTDMNSMTALRDITRVANDARSKAIKDDANAHEIRNELDGIKDDQDKFDHELTTMQMNLDSKTDAIEKEINKQFDQNELLLHKATDEITKAMNVSNTFQSDKPTTLSELSESLIKYCLLKKNVKLPNNFNAYFNYHYVEHIPKSTLIKKHKLKFVDAFMEYHGLSGNEIKKNLHICTQTNVHVLKTAINYFGYDKVYKSNIILDLLNQEMSKSFYNFPESFTKSEKEKLFTYYLWHLKGDINSNTLTDHIIYYNQLKLYGERISLNSKNINDFVTEHANWSVMISSYKSGYNVRSYNDGFVEGVQKSIFDYNGVEYKPVVLLTTDDYTGESAYQNNCVRTYIDRCSSVIVSLRNGEERATIEYMVTYYPNMDKIKMNRVQSLGRFNRQLSEIWNPVLEILDVQVGMACREHKFTSSIKTSYMNGKSVTRTMVTKKPKTTHDDLQYIGLVQWDTSIENQNNFNFNFDF